MLTSDFNLQKRQEQEKQLKKILIAGFAGSMIFHGIAIIFFPNWFPQQSSKKASKPIELIIVDPPKPETKPVETKILPEPVPKPLPLPPEAEKIPESPKLTPKPVQAKAPESPKPIPKTPSKPQQILTSSNTPTPNSVSVAPSTQSIAPPGNTESTSESNNNNSSTEVAANTAPSRSPATSTGGGGVTCLKNCQPEYPSALNGKEGRASVRLTIDKGGNVVGATLANPNSNAMINRQALLAARRMKFSAVSYEAGVSVVVKINFTLAGSEFDRQARQRQEEIEREKKAKLERERQERERALQEQRRAELETKRQAELERQKQEAVETVTDSAPATPSLTPIDKDDEMLRKFRERMQNHQNSN